MITTTINFPQSLDVNGAFEPDELKLLSGPITEHLNMPKRLFLAGFPKTQTVVLLLNKAKFVRQCVKTLPSPYDIAVGTLRDETYYCIYGNQKGIFECSLSINNAYRPEEIDTSIQEEEKKSIPVPLNSLPLEITKQIKLL